MSLAAAVSSVCAPCKACGVRDLSMTVTCPTCQGVWHARCALPRVRNAVLNGWFCAEHWRDAVSSGWTMQHYDRPPPGSGASAEDKTLYQRFVAAMQMKEAGVGKAFVARIRPLFGESLRGKVYVWWVDECPLDYSPYDCRLNVFTHSRRKYPTFYKIAVGAAHIRDAAHLCGALLREMLRIVRRSGGEGVMMDVVARVVGEVEMEVMMPGED